MIKDRLENAALYYGLSERFKQSFEWLKNTDLLNIPDGRYFIDGEHIFANVQSYETKDNAPFEAHRKYADIQFMVKGQEKCGITNYLNCTKEIEYDCEKDIEFLKCASGECQILNEGEFFVFFPSDAHQPALNPDKKMNVKKVVVKVKL